MGALRRHGQVIDLDPSQREAYVQLHAAAWPGVLETITANGIRNYSIFEHDNRLFAYFEYVGDDYDSDMARIAEDPVTQEWWSVCKPMQRPLPTAGPDDWWVDMTEVFHHD